MFHNRLRTPLMRLALLLALLTGCSATVDEFVGVQLARVMDTTVVRELNHADRPGGGPAYAVSFDVPESWVYTVRTQISGPRLTFELLLDDFEYRIGQDVALPIFYVTALASGTYEDEAEGEGEPWFEGVVANTEDTYFVWHLPEDDAASADVATLQTAVPTILESVTLKPLE